MTLFDWTQYLPESLKTKYEVAGVPQTIIEKVLQLLVQVLSGNAGTTADFESKLLELKYFWDAYGTQDLSKLKTLLDSHGITTKVAYINELCGTSTPTDSEKAYLATVQAVGKMKGTLKGVQNILRLFGITISIIPWYDPLYPDPEVEECNVIITASLDSGCLVEGSYNTVEDIIKLLLDVCAIIKRFDLVKRFKTQIPFAETLQLDIEPLICDYYDWRNSRECLDVLAIASPMPTAFYTGQTVCVDNFIHNGIYFTQCQDYLDCVRKRIDLNITDPIIRASSELDIKNIVFQQGNTIRYNFDFVLNFGQGCGYGIAIGDPIRIDFSINIINNGDFLISAFDNVDNWIEIVNVLRSDSSNDETNSPAVMAINLSPYTNKLIIDYNYPVRIPIYGPGFIPDAGDDISANLLLGTKWIRGGDYRKGPDIFSGLYSIKHAGVQWTLYEFDSIGNEYYLEKAGGGDPELIVEPNILTEDETELVKGTAGDLNLGEWDYYMDGAIGFNTIFIKLLDGSNPSLKIDHSLEAGTKKDYCDLIDITHAPGSLWSGPITA